MEKIKLQLNEKTPQHDTPSKNQLTEDSFNGLTLAEIVPEVPPPSRTEQEEIQWVNSLMKMQEMSSYIDNEYESPNMKQITKIMRLRELEDIDRKLKRKKRNEPVVEDMP